LFFRDVYSPKPEMKLEKTDKMPGRCTKSNVTSIIDSVMKKRNKI